MLAHYLSVIAALPMLAPAGPHGGEEQALPQIDFAALAGEFLEALGSSPRASLPACSREGGSPASP